MTARGFAKLFAPAAFPRCAAGAESGYKSGMRTDAASISFRSWVWALSAFAGLHCAVWAQGPGSGQNATGRTYQYSGGGIRGATEVVADGWLVSPNEAREFGGEEGFNEQPGPRRRGITPQLEIQKPQLPPGQKLKAPFALALSFPAPADAPADPSTFKVLYGAGRVDITARLVKSGQVTASGVVLDNAWLPPGKHRLILQVQDARQRLYQREWRVEVE